MESETAQRMTATVTIEKMVYGGEGLARTGEGVLLVPWVLPGERAVVQPEERHKGVSRARLLEVLDPSPDRIAPGCTYFGRCGGCHYQHTTYARQLALKQEILQEGFERIGKFRLNVPVSVLSAEPWNYRNRTRLQIEKSAERFEIGYFELLSHRLCPIESCPVSSPAINEVIGKLGSSLGAALFPDGSAKIELFANDSDQKLLATIDSPELAPPIFGDALRSALPEIESVCWRQKSGRRAAKATIWGRGSIAYHVGEFHYSIGHDSFFQSNRFLLDGFLRLVVDDLEGKRALDLYAGAGLFTIPLAHRFERVAAVESQPAAARDLASNIGVVSDRARSYHLTAEKFLATATRDWEAIVMDPPRSGLNKIVLEHLGRLRARRLVYVSCDPTRLARDLGVLTRAGYAIRSVHLVDQFPQTFHIETVVHMEHQG